jgi:hypothetical protein
MSLNLTDDEIHGLIDYARDKFAAERYPFAPALKAIRETLAKLDPKPKLQPPAPKKPYVRALCSNKGQAPPSILFGRQRVHAIASSRVPLARPLWCVIAGIFS